MFIDYHHKVIKNGDFVIKTLQNTKRLRKEFEIQKFLSKYHLAPKVIGLKGLSFKEEFIDGLLLKDVIIDDSLVIELAKLLNKIHLIKLPNKIKLLIEDEFTKSGIYQPRLIFQELVKDVRFEELNSCFTLAEKYIVKVEKYLKDKHDYMCLVHGDLSMNNIVVSPNKIVIIDWADCRLDIPTTDISQLFYLCNFTLNQQEIFLNEYNYRGFINKDLIDLNTVLLLIYDLCKEFRDTGKCDNDLLNKLKTYA